MLESSLRCRQCDYRGVSARALVLGDYYNLFHRMRSNVVREICLALGSIINIYHK